MERRQFLGLMAALAAAPALGPIARPALAAERLPLWDPAPRATSLNDYVALEWRYLAGRITTDSEDFGFVVSLADYNPMEPPLPPLINWNYYELLVMRQDFTGAGAHVTNTYRVLGTINYNPTTATFNFAIAGSPTVSASWRFDAATQTYALSVNTPELTLDNLLLTPQGTLIPEGGDGSVESGKVVVNNVPLRVVSDYYADWVSISRAGQNIGLGRLDMQTLKPLLDVGGSGGSTFSHHWFCLACTLADDTPAWLTAWEIVSGGSTVWGYTLATGSGAGWRVSSVTNEGFSGVQPLGVQILAWQPVPNTTPARRSGRRWRLQHGVTTAADALDLELEVPAGQFIKGARISSLTEIAMQESAGIQASGTVGGQAIKAVSFAVAESTYNELAPPAGRERRVFIPAVLR